MSTRFLVPIRDLVEALETDPRWAPQVTAVRHLPAAEAHAGAWPLGLDPRVRAAAEGQGIERLYRHQAAAVAAALHGRHVVVATGTASGKSLCYQLPALHALAGDPAARALFLFPTKALAHDQLAALARWEAALPDLDVQAAAYDGDTPPAQRAAVRRRARLLVTNPDMLHTGILPHHTAWAPLLEGLRLVVLDEMHVYRGVFGSHVANVLRRLRRIAAFYGAWPQFILTSATIANPEEQGRLLAGAPVTVIDQNGAPRGRRSFIFYNPPVVDERLNLRRSPILEADALARHFLAAGVQTIVFARTRQSAELIVRYIGEGLDAHGLDSATPTPRMRGHGAEPAIVRGYRGGYTARDRRAIESALRDGRLRGVVATNALELGIDIGELDACVMAGYPGTIASTWQQAGRAGRQTDDAVAVLVAGGAPLDQFILRHPEYVFDRSPEHARLDPDNLLILLDHVRCAAFELPFGQPVPSPRPEGTRSLSGGTGAGEEGDAGGGEVNGEPSGAGLDELPLVRELLGVLAAQGMVRSVGESWYWMADAYPAAGVSLRSVGTTAVTIVQRGSGDGAGAAGDPDTDEVEAFDVLGTIERSAAALMVHPGAIYLHDGQAYAVQSLDWENGRATVAPADGAIYTRASASVDIRPTQVAASRPVAGATVSYGELEVRSRVTSFRQVRFRTHETVGWGEVDLPEQVHLAGGYWFTLDEETVERLRAIGHWRFDPLADRGPSWGQQRDRARARDGFRCRMCGAPERPDRGHDVHHIRPFREFGWVKGQNNAYVAANTLENLITLCRGCHRAAERALGLHGGLSGLGYALAHAAPLYLMCDGRDLGVTAESHAPWSKRPTIAIFERAAAGVGFGEALYRLHEELLAACATLIADCPCADGCPSCVGPADERGPDAKGHALAVLEALRTPAGSDEEQRC